MVAASLACSLSSSSSQRLPSALGCTLAPAPIAVAASDSLTRSLASILARAALTVSVLAVQAISAIFLSGSG